VEWSYHFGMLSRRSEEEARKEVDDTITYDRAVLAERGENYPKAAMLYEKLLASDPKNIQARYNLARIYHRKLDDLGNALMHYKKLSEHAPPDHPYRGEAMNVLKNPKRSDRS
jgi:tetratricopeptide (TPR) repeat protein